MSGFDNEVVYAENLDFSGSSEVDATITTNGQLIIGSTALNAGGTHINIGNIVGSGGITVGYSSPNITLTLSGDGIYKSLSPYIVGTDIHSSYGTIAAAIAAAVADGASSTNPANIYIKQKTTGGSYTENLTLSDGINLIGFNAATSIVGNTTFSTAGTASISGLKLQTNSAALITVAGSSATILNVSNCFLNCTNNTGISYSTASASSQINLYQCEGNLGTTGIALHSISSTGTFSMHFCRFTNSGGSSTASTISAGIGNYLESYMDSPLSSSGTSSIGMNYFKMSTAAQNVTCFTCAGSSGTANNCGFASGSATAVICTSPVELTNSVISCTNASSISGASSIKYGCIIFDNTSSSITATTQTPCVQTNDALKLVAPGAYPYTTTAQDGVILVDTSAARTIIPMASPTAGQKHIIKDSVGTAAANNITITPSGKNIDGAASSTMNVNYGSVTIVYNGTEWSII